MYADRNLIMLDSYGIVMGDRIFTRFALNMIYGAVLGSFGYIYKRCMTYM